MMDDDIPDDLKAEADALAAAGHAVTDADLYPAPIVQRITAAAADEMIAWLDRASAPD